MVAAINRSVTWTAKRTQVKRDDACIVDCFPGMDATERLVPSELQWTVTIKREKREPERPPTWPPGDYDTELVARQMAGHRADANLMVTVAIVLAVVVAGLLMLAAVFPK